MRGEGGKGGKEGGRKGKTETDSRRWGLANVRKKRKEDCLESTIRNLTGVMMKGGEQKLDYS